MQFDSEGTEYNKAFGSMKILQYEQGFQHFTDESTSFSNLASYPHTLGS